MKRVLIVGFFWPYNMHGSGRMLGLARYLPLNGWQPHIITGPVSAPVKESVGYTEISYKGDVFERIRRVLMRRGYARNESLTYQLHKDSGSLRKWLVTKARDYYLELFAYPDSDKHWVEPALEKAREVLREDKFDAIMSVQPVSSHLIADRLKKEFGLPWLADFPDPWAYNHASPYGRIRRFFDARLERRLVSNVDRLTAATPLYADRGKLVHGRDSVVITNGFDPGDVNPTPVPDRLSGKFTISYTGSIYQGYQNPEPIFIALSELIASGAVDRGDVLLRFYGKDNLIDELIRRYDMAGVAVYGGKIRKDEVLAIQRESQLLLMLNWEDRRSLGVYPLKFFEYLASFRPVLATGGHRGDYIEGMMEELGCGVFVPTVEEIKRAVLDYYRQYREKGYIDYIADRDACMKYSTRGMAAAFARELDAISGASRN